MIPQAQPRKKKNSSKVNLTISVVFHVLLIGGLIYFAARQGFLGKKLKEITVYKVEKEKPPEPPKQKPPEPPKDLPKPVEAPKMAETPAPTPPPANVPVSAPAAAQVADFNFNDGAKAVNTENDPVQLYKGYIEYCMRSKWNRPDNMQDDNYTVEVSVAVDKQGNLSQPRWLKRSGDNRWDQSVQDALNQVDHIDRRPPTNFPSQVTIRFDVQQETEPVMQ